LFIETNGYEEEYSGLISRVSKDGASHIFNVLNAKKYEVAGILLNSQSLEHHISGVDLKELHQLEEHLKFIGDVIKEKNDKEDVKSFTGLCLYLLAYSGCEVCFSRTVDILTNNKEFFVTLVNFHNSKMWECAKVVLKEGVERRLDCV
jgi:hypothetical protein